MVVTSRVFIVTAMDPSTIYTDTLTILPVQTDVTPIAPPLDVPIIHSPRTFTWQDHVCDKTRICMQPTLCWQCGYRKPGNCTARGCEYCLRFGRCTLCQPTACPHDGRLAFAVFGICSVCKKRMVIWERTLRAKIPPVCYPCRDL